MGGAAKLKASKDRKEWCYPCWSGNCGRCLGPSKCPCRHRTAVAKQESET